MPRTDLTSSPGGLSRPRVPLVLAPPVPAPPVLSPLVLALAAPAWAAPDSPGADRRRRIWPLTGRSGGAAPAGRPSIDPEFQPAARTTQRARIRVPSPSRAPAARPLALRISAAGCLMMSAPAIAAEI